MRLPCISVLLVYHKPYFYPDLVWLSLIIDRCLIKLTVKTQSDKFNSPELAIFFSFFTSRNRKLTWSASLCIRSSVYDISGISRRRKVCIFVKQFGNEVEFLLLFQDFQITCSTIWTHRLITDVLSHTPDKKNLERFNQTSKCWLESQETCLLGNKYRNLGKDWTKISRHLWIINKWLHY